MRDLRRWLGELFVYDVGEQQRLQRAAAARGYGLPGAAFAQPMPGSSVSLTQTSSTTHVHPRKAGRLLTLLVITLAVLGLAGLVAGVAIALKSRSPTTTAPATTAPAAQPAPVDPIELELQWWTDELGKIHFTPPTPGKPKATP